MGAASHVRFGAIGDIHGDFATVRRIIARHPDVAFWVTPGDVGGDEGHYEEPPAPLYWIKGNNENFDVVSGLADGSARIPNLEYIPNGVAVDAGPLRVAGLGGTFAPTWYETPAAELPHPVMPRSTATRDKRRHFVREEVERCTRLDGIDLFLSHEAARPFHVAGRDGRPGMDAGKTPINEILAGMKPRLHLFGHHHRFDRRVRQGVPSIGLDGVGVSYLIIESETLGVERLESR